MNSKKKKLISFLFRSASFPGATNETLLQKFNSVNKDNEYYEVPQKREAAFIVRHYAGKVKYQSNEFREKNLDLMKADIVAVLKSSQYAFVRELVGGDPVAVFRWAILRAFIRAYFAFIASGKRHRGEFYCCFLLDGIYYFILLLFNYYLFYFFFRFDFVGPGQPDGQRERWRQRPQEQGVESEEPAVEELAQFGNG